MELRRKQESTNKPTRVQFLGRKDPLEKEFPTILAWEIPYIGEPGRLQSMGLQRVGHDRMINTFTYVN